MRATGVAIAAALAAAASSAGATPPYDETPRLPSQESAASMMERYYPQRARDQEIEGKAVIECTIQPDGALTACAVVSESPAGMGFGEASIRVASKLRMRSHSSRYRGRTSAQGSAAGPRVRIPLTWALTDDPPPPLPVPTGD